MGNEIDIEKIYLYIQEYTSEYGYAPTYRDIGIYMGGLSTSSVSNYIDILEERGMIKKERGKKSRTLVLTKKKYKKVRKNENVIDILSKDREDIKSKIKTATDIDFYVLNGILKYIDKLKEKLK